MKIKAQSPFIFIFLFIFILSIAAKTQEDEKVVWKGTIEIEGGEKVIKNPGDPLYGDIKLELEEDLSIGNEEDDNYLFFRISDIQVDTDGNIYVLDSGNHRVQVFNKNGNYIRTIGKKGQGPGEFNTPTRLQLDDETGNIYVVDNMLRKIIIFEKEGKYLDKDVLLVEILNDFCLDSDRSIWGKFTLPGIDTYRSIKKITRAGKVENTLLEIPYYINRIKLSTSKVGNISYLEGSFFTHGYEDDLFISKVDSHTLVYGHSKKYELVVVDRSGKTLFLIRKDEIPKEITKNEKDRIKNQEIWNIRKRGYFVSDLPIKFPDYMPYFYSILADNEGRIYVRKNPLLRYSSVNHEYDVFNKEGLYLYKIHLNHHPDIIKNGYVYTRIANEETGEEQGKRFLIKNWQQLKQDL